MGDAPGALGGAIPQDETLRFASAAKEDNILVRGTAVCYPPIPNAYGSWARISPPLTTNCPLWQQKRTSRFCHGE